MRERTKTGKKTGKPKKSDSQLNPSTQQVFATVMNTYRHARLVCAQIHAVNYADDGSGRSNHLSERQTNFICDVELAMAEVLPPAVLPYVLACYGRFDLDDIEIEKLASKVIHGGQGRVQSLKHRCAREFQRRGISPLSKYMNPKRGK